MKIKTRKFTKFISLLLVLCTIFVSMPIMSVSAEDEILEESSNVLSEVVNEETPGEAVGNDEAPNWNTEGDLTPEELESAVLPEEDKPEIVSQADIDEKQHVNRLWEQEEDLNSIIFQNKDGSKTMYYFEDAVKYIDENGKVKDKKNTIVATKNGDFTNPYNDINAYFPKKIHKNKGVVVTFGEYSIEFAPAINGSSGASRQTGHNKYQDPTEYVEYPNVFDEDIAVRYTPTFEGYKEDIILYKNTGINTFTFKVTTNGLSLVQDESGAYVFVNALTGEVLSQLGQLVIYDSNPEGEDYFESLTKYNHQYIVQTIEQDNLYTVTIVVDPLYLNDSDRVYPVFVDPTVTIETSGSGTSKTIQDAPLYYESSAARGGNTYNVVGYQGSYGAGRTLMKFPGLASNTTFSGLTINQITNLDLHMYEGSGSSKTAKIGLCWYTGPAWNENTVKCTAPIWTNFGASFSSTTISKSGWHTFNLKNAVSTWKTNSAAFENGIVLKNLTAESSLEYGKHFLSTESGTKPYLTFDYVSTVNVTHVRMKAQLSINVANTSFLSAAVEPYDATNTTVRYASSNPEIATVGNYSGMVTAKKGGTALITAISDDGNHVAYCQVTVNYCGGDATHDVSRHNLNYMSNGYYQCTVCGYEVCSPELQDHEILSTDDYLKIVALQHYYAQCVFLAQEQSQNYYLYLADQANICINTIRSKDCYKTRYDYTNANNEYYAPIINNDLLSRVINTDVGYLDYIQYTDLDETIYSIVLGYVCPPLSDVLALEDLINGEMNAWDVGALIAGYCNLDAVSTALTLASGIIHAIESDIHVGDRVIIIDINSFFTCDYVFDSNNNIKHIETN